MTEFVVLTSFRCSQRCVPELVKFYKGSEQCKQVCNGSGRPMGFSHTHIHN